MRINKYVALANGLSRRAADVAIVDGRVLINGQRPSAGQQVVEGDTVMLDKSPIKPVSDRTTIMLNKPVGYVCSRDGQGSRTIYDLLPDSLSHLKPVGRLDKNSSGLLLLTDDGDMAQKLTHPKYQKIKKYKIAINRNLAPDDYTKITGDGVMLDDGISRLQLEAMNNQPKEWKVTMHEGRNRQIRRTFEALGYNVVKLHRTHLGTYILSNLETGRFIRV